MVSLQINITAVDILKLELQASYCLLPQVNIIVGKRRLIVYHLVVIRINGYLFYDALVSRYIQCIKGSKIGRR